MHGFFLIDKPTGISSFDCIRRLRKVINMRRMGFAGTLDPLATGLMIVAVGEATKLLPYLEKSDKVYEVLMYLGAISDTYDAQGKIVESGHNVIASIKKKLSRDTLAKILEEDFLGPRQQTPPAFSAIHINGQRAYDLARKGQKIDLKPRAVHFFDFKIKSFSWPNLKIQVHCSSGTYMRSFAHDMGQNLGCGAYVKELRRLKIGSFSIKNAVDLNDLTVTNCRKYLLTPQEFFSDWPKIDLDENSYKILAHGGMIENFTHLSKGRFLAIYNSYCVGVLEVKNQKIKFERKFNI